MSEHVIHTFTQAAAVRVTIKPQIEGVVLTFPSDVKTSAEVNGALGAVAMARVASRLNIPIERLAFSIDSSSRVGVSDVVLDRDPTL